MRHTLDPEIGLKIPLSIILVLLLVNLGEAAAFVAPISRGSN